MSKVIYGNDECPMTFHAGDTLIFSPSITISIQKTYTFTEKNCRELTHLIYDYLRPLVKGKEK